MAVSNDRKTRRILGHARSMASTMKYGQRRFVPRQQVNNGKVMIEKGPNDKFKVYMFSNKSFQGSNGKKEYAIKVFNGSNKGVTDSGGAYRHNSDVFKKLHGKLLTFKTGKRSYKEGSTGSRGD